MTGQTSLYDDAHLFVAAIRVLFHQKKAPPTVEEVCEMLGHSTEWGLLLCRRLEERRILDQVDDPFSSKLFIADHLAIEDLPRQQEKSALDRELERFRREKQDIEDKISAIQEELDKKKNDLFAELEKKLREQGENQ